MQPRVELFRSIWVERFCFSRRRSTKRRRRKFLEFFLVKKEIRRRKFSLCRSFAKHFVRISSEKPIDLVMDVTLQRESSKTICRTEFFFINSKKTFFRMKKEIFRQNSKRRRRRWFSISLFVDLRGEKSAWFCWWRSRRSLGSSVASTNKSSFNLGTTRKVKEKLGENSFSSLEKSFVFFSFLYKKIRPFLFDIRNDDRPFQHLCLLLLWRKPLIERPLAIEYRPIGIEEFLRDLCYVLMGISSETFQWNEVRFFCVFHTRKFYTNLRSIITRKAPLSNLNLITFLTNRSLYFV